MNQDFPPSPPVLNRTTCGLSIASLILGCLVFIVGCLTGIPAIVCGILALNKIGKNPGMEGKGMAIAGIILGAFSLLVIPIIAAIAIPAFSGAMTKATQVLELNQAKSLGNMLTSYAQSHGGKYPDSLEALAEENRTTNGELEILLYEPGTREFRWTLTPGVTTDSPSDTVVLQSRINKGAGRAVYFQGGAAKWVKDDGQ